MTFATELIDDVNQILSYGEQVRFKYFNQSITGEYDDDVLLTQSGTDYWCSGLAQPINSNQYSSDGLLVQQGKLLQDDKKLYVNSEVQTSGIGPIKIGMNGSSSTQEYQIVNEGQVTEWGINGSLVYKKIFIRYLTNGSFIGEN